MIAYNNFDVDLCDREGKPPLVYALSVYCRSAQRYHVFETLVRANANLEFITNNGRTLQDFIPAAEYGNPMEKDAEFQRIIDRVRQENLSVQKKFNHV